MWTLGKALLLRWVLARSFGGLLGFLVAVVLPFAGILKIIGLPLLFVLLIVGAPVILVLMIIGLPLLLVLGAAGAVVALVTLVLTVAMMGFKLLLPVLIFLIPVIGVFILLRWLWRRRKNGGAPPATTPPTPPPYSGPSEPPTASTIDPLES